MNKESNKYIFLYSIVLVVVVALVLSVAYIGLKSFQKKNIEVEKKQNILRSVRKALDANSAKNKTQYIEDEYGKYITSSFIVNSQGQRVEGNAFEVSMEEENAKPLFERHLSVFVCTDDDGTKKYILPVRGLGLWGPIWGYVALMDDYTTIYGAVFDHKGETPGLGAEISTFDYQKQFTGKQIFDKDNSFTSVKVVKGGGTRGNLHEVDAVSGGTITSKGLEAALSASLSGYINFFKEEKQQQERSKKIEQEKETELVENTPVAPPRYVRETVIDTVKKQVETKSVVHDSVHVN